jgi:hypothetical protein
MAHHRRSPNHPLNESSREIEKGKEDAPPHEKRKSVFDYEIAGFPWPFVAVISVIVIAVLGMVLKVMGVF